MTEGRKRQAEYAKRQRELGRRQSSFWLTPEEKKAVTDLLEQLRQDQERRGKGRPINVTGEDETKNEGKEEEKATGQYGESAPEYLFATTAGNGPKGS